MFLTPSPLDYLFEWDEAKNKSNLEKHGVALSSIAQIFDEDYVEYSSLTSKENRWVRIVEYQTVLFAVVYTLRPPKIRLIFRTKSP